VSSGQVRDRQPSGRAGQSRRLAVRMGGPRGRVRWAEQGGSGTLLVVLGVVLLTVLAAAGAALGSVLVARTRLAAAADLGALAAASAALEPEVVACARAGAVVRANAARMRSCRILGAHAWVEVAVDAPPSVAALTGGRSAQLVARGHAELVPSPRWSVGRR
jgi:secretion/DNA translocation related TadE-like protein